MPNVRSVAPWAGQVRRGFSALLPGSSQQPANFGVDRGLIHWPFRPRPFAKRLHGSCARITHCPQVGRVDLSMAVKSSKISVDDGRSQKRRKTTGQEFLKRPATRMKNVEVVFKSNRLSCYLLWIDHIGDNSSGFFLRGKASNDDVKSVRKEPFFGSGVARDGVGLLKAGLGPADGAVFEMPGIKQGNSARFRLGSKMIVQTKIDNRSCRYFEAELVQRILERGSLQQFGVAIGWDVNELFGVVREHDFADWEGVRGEVRKTAVRRHRDNYVFLTRATLEQENHIFLQNSVGFESAIARIEQVDLTNCGALQNPSAERLVVRAVTKAARDDCDELPSRFKQFERKGDKPRIEIDGFEASDPQQCAVFRGAADLLVRRVQDRMREALTDSRSNVPGRQRDEVAFDQLGLNVVVVERRQSGAQFRQNRFVDFVCASLKRPLRSRFPPNLDGGRCQCAASRASVQEANFIEGRKVEQVGHESRDPARRQKLPQR